MTAPTITPGSPEWLRTITASKIPAILGVSRWQSQWALWHEMAGLIEPAPIDQATQDMFDEGHALEAASLALWRRKYPDWQVSHGEVEYRRDDLPFPMVATIDNRATRRGYPVGAKHSHILETKSARSLEEWGDDGSGDAPVDYIVQVVAQMGISGLRSAEILLWPRYGGPRFYPVKWDSEMWDHIVDKCRAWHDSLQAGTPPALDDSVACYQAVRRMHPDIDGSTVQISADLAARYLGLDEVLRDTEKKMRATKTRLLDAMGNAATAECYGVTIATRYPHGKGIALRPKRTATEEIRNLNLT